MLWSRYSDWPGAGRLGFDSRQAQNIFLYFTVSRPTLGPTQPLIRWVLEALSPEVKRPSREVGCSPLSSSEVKSYGAILPLPDTPSWHGAFLFLPSMLCRARGWSQIIKRQLLYDWRFTTNQFILATSPLRLTTSNFFFQLNTCSYSPYVTISLMRRWVCRLQLLLALASAAVLRSESHGSHDQIILSQILYYAKLEGQVPVFTCPRNRVAQLYCQEPSSIFAASYVSKGYGGGIRPRLHTDSDNWISDDPEIRSLNRTKIMAVYRN
jgi:hypothetical protein